MTTIYLIRHAEAEGNLYRVYQGQYDTLLTETGKLQVQALGERFRDIHVDAVYSSDLYRAACTAAVICRMKGLPLNQVPALREIDVGSRQAKAMGDVRRAEAQEGRQGLSEQEKCRIRGGETSEQVRVRTLAALQTIAAAHEGETVVVVSHGAAIRYVVTHLLGAERDSLVTGQNTGVSVLEWENGALRVVDYNDASHLDVWMEKLLGRPYHQRDTGLQPGLWYRNPETEECGKWLRAAFQLPEGAACPSYDAADVLLGIREEEPAGILALLPEKDAEQGIGWIDALWVKPELRCRSCGIQLLGQAVFRYRALGRGILRTAVPETDGTTLEFLRHHGFVPVEEQTGDGRCILEKDIAFHPLGGITITRRVHYHQGISETSAL